MANRPKPEILEYKKIGRFDGYRTTAFFGFDLPRDPCKKRLHFHMPMTPSKWVFQIFFCKFISDVSKFSLRYVAVRRSKSFENLFSSDDGSSVLAAGDNLKAVSVADQVPEIKGVEAIRALLYEKFGVLWVKQTIKRASSLVPTFRLAWAFCQTLLKPRGCGFTSSKFFCAGNVSNLLFLARKFLETLKILHKFDFMKHRVTHCEQRFAPRQVELFVMDLALMDSFISSRGIHFNTECRSEGSKDF